MHRVSNSASMLRKFYSSTFNLSFPAQFSPYLRSWLVSSKTQLEAAFLHFAQLHSCQTPFLYRFIEILYSKKSKLCQLVLFCSVSKLPFLSINRPDYLQQVVNRKLHVCGGRSLWKIFSFDRCAKSLIVWKVENCCYCWIVTIFKLLHLRTFRFSFLKIVSIRSSVGLGNLFESERVGSVSCFTILMVPLWQIMVVVMNQLSFHTATSPSRKCRLDFFHQIFIWKQ